MWKWSTCCHLFLLFCKFFDFLPPAAINESLLPQQMLPQFPLSRSTCLALSFPCVSLWNLCKKDFILANQLLAIFLPWVRQMCLHFALCLVSCTWACTLWIVTALGPNFMKLNWAEVNMKLGGGGVVWQQRRCFLSMSTLTVTGRIYLLTARMERKCSYSNKSSLNTHTSSECYIKICIALLLSQFQMYFIVFSWLVLVSERVCSLPLIFLQQPFTRWHFNLSA